jgi:cell division protein FtsN
MEAVMKRAAVFGIVVAVIVTTWTILVAQTSPVRVSSPAQQVAPDPVASAPIPAPVLALSPLTPLQQRFVELSTKKARLMTEEQLQQAVNELDRDVEGRNAWSKLEDGARLLREVVEKHPQTRAAEAAKSALKVIDQTRSGVSPTS